MQKTQKTGNGDMKAAKEQKQKQKQKQELQTSSSSSSSSSSPASSSASSPRSCLPQADGGTGTRKRKKKKKKRRSDAGRRCRGSYTYDSALGITCHFCRQKTVDKKVWCSRCVSAFCRRCLRTRHGEDLDVELRYGLWICPKCRGGCGPACQNCCSCGLCRAKLGLMPTKVLFCELRAAGFDNVHDYLIHLKTKESPRDISARKSGRGWCKTEFKGSGSMKGSTAYEKQGLDCDNVGGDSGNPVGLKDVNLPNSWKSSQDQDTGCDFFTNHSINKSSPISLKDISTKTSSTSYISLKDNTGRQYNSRDMGDNSYMNHKDNKRTSISLKDIGMTKGLKSSHNQDTGCDFFMNHSINKSSPISLKDFSTLKDSRGHQYNSRDMCDDFYMNHKDNKSTPISLKDFNMIKGLKSSHNQDTGCDFFINHNIDKSSPISLKDISTKNSSTSSISLKDGRGHQYNSRDMCDFYMNNKDNKSASISLKDINMTNCRVNESKPMDSNDINSPNSSMTSYDRGISNASCMNSSAIKRNSTGLKDMNATCSSIPSHSGDVGNILSMKNINMENSLTSHNQDAGDNLSMKYVDARNCSTAHNQEDGKNVCSNNSATKSNPMGSEYRNAKESPTYFHKRGIGSDFCDQHLKFSRVIDPCMYNNTMKSSQTGLKGIDVAKRSMEYHNRDKAYDSNAHGSASNSSMTCLKGLDVTQILMAFHGRAGSKYTERKDDNKSQGKTLETKGSEEEHAGSHVSYVRENDSEVDDELHTLTCEVTRSKMHSSAMKSLKKCSERDDNEMRNSQQFQDSDNVSEYGTYRDFRKSSPKGNGESEVRIERRLSNLMVPICFNSRNSYEHNLKAILSAPFDPVELKQKWINVGCRKMMSPAIETEVETLDLRTTRLGSAYIDHYPDFASRLRASTTPEEKLSLLRGFFFWLEHVSTTGAFKPWLEKEKDPDCIDLDGSDCEILGEVLCLDDD